MTKTYYLRSVGRQSARILGQSSWLQCQDLRVQISQNSLLKRQEIYQTENRRIKSGTTWNIKQNQLTVEFSSSECSRSRLVFIRNCCLLVTRRRVDEVDVQVTVTDLVMFLLCFILLNNSVTGCNEMIIV